MENILKNIKEHKLLKPGQVVAVATSGGSDSMALLHFLNAHKTELDIDICAVHIDHSLRENSSEDANFVMTYCKQHGIRAYKFKIDVNKLASQKNLSIETAAREARYGVFEALLKKDVADKIAIAHNQNDQAETILQNIFRGAGVQGAKGMDFEREGVYIRPMLTTTKKAILDYIFINDIPYKDDQTNADNQFSRNFIRNQILPLIKERWPNAVNAIVEFGKACKEDNEYIAGQLFEDAIIYEERLAKIPVSYFLYPSSIVSRMIFTALKSIGVKKDIERVHIGMIMDLALNSDNGKKIKLPMKVTAFKEYDYITLTNNFKEKPKLEKPFEIGTFEVAGFGKIWVKKSKILTLKPGELIISPQKLPKDAVWRFRERGDTFTKFGGGTKKLKDYLIDKKIPARLRDNLPVLASGKEILAIAGVEISEKVRTENGEVPVYKIISPLWKC
ncbi:MAG: tRNA lysidine(34) synthetase TilS [Clostridia bacterium]|nr:tRNA lysidine(34) synthetase TilS [Clostridia bacterium]